MRFTTPSFKDVEGERKITSPNLMSVIRGAGGIALGIGMAANLVEPGAAVATSSVLAATDAEGLVILGTEKLPRLQRILRSFPSEWGRKLDPIADKLYALGILGGGMGSQAIPVEQGAAVIATEVATMGATLISTSRRGGVVPEVGVPNKIGMVMRIQMIAGELGAQAVHGGLHDVLSVAGEVGFVGAVGFGLASIANIWRQGNETMPEPVE